ncbi:FAD-dependent oxidoreductase [Alteribacter aurantiacus]|uniref:FAD-dependent oxidoreductase n=1 Tax=Alteribacter aurantiacus TaxID=254410 RepID=UPI0004177A7C|nr:FAD-dependent oxidoreductase [Alteribacter aurantiacus]
MNDQVPKFPEPYWRIDMEPFDFPTLSEDTSCEVVVVGGGIAGITTAYLLQKEGKNVVLLDAGVLINGTTGHTTAKITSQHGLFYHELIQHFGKEKARLYYDANQEGLELIESLVNDLGIDCDFSHEDAFVFTTDPDEIFNIKKEDDAYSELDINGGLIDEKTLPIHARAAIVMRDQAQFHPVKYLNVLVKEFVKAGGTVYENTTANDVKTGERPRVVTRDGHEVECDYVVAASHFPFYDGMGLYYTRMHAERSYSLAVKTSKPIATGMYINVEDPKRSIRSTPGADGPLMIIGGEKHKTGQGVDTSKHYEALAAYSKELFPDGEILHRWATHDLITMDKVPYIGHLTKKHKNIFVATGFHKWGMTNGTVAAKIIRDGILEKDNRYTELFTPHRMKADPGIKEFVKENANVAKYFVKGKVDMVRRKPEDLTSDEGGVVTVRGKRAGAYKDLDGRLHVVDTTCTHLGCECEWNDGDRTWDCPCHGSRFDVEGVVIEGPADKPLKKLDLD